MTKTWFITGINGGLGRQMATQLLERGDRVFGTVRNRDAVADLEQRFTNGLVVDELDVTDTPAVKTLVKEAFARMGRIDVIVNNAGYGLFGVAEGLESASIRHQIDTNLVGPIEVTRTALPFLRAQGGGHITAISTYGGQATHPGASLYHASKWGMEGFFDSLAAEVAGFNISVTIVEPGGARTAFRQAAGAQAGKLPDAYKYTPVGTMLSRLADPSFIANGDPARMATRIIESADRPSASRRLILGSDAYGMIEKALTGRLAELQAQKDDAPTTDFPA